MTENTAVAEVEAQQPEATEAPAHEATPEVVPPPVAPVAPAPRVGNAAWAPEEEREHVAGIMAELRAAGYTRPELSALTGFSDSAVWRAQQRKVWTIEIDVWMDKVFEPWNAGTLIQTNPPAKSLRAPKPEVLQAKITEVEAKIARAVEALTNPEIKTVKEFRTLVAEVTASLSA